MFVAACPACREQVTVPSDRSPTTLVQCPWCHAECRLAEFLDQLPPMLAVVTDAETAVEERSAAEAYSADIAHEADVPPFDFTPAAESSSAVEWRGAGRRAVRPRPNVAWEITKVVGGALLAVPAAQMILWWCVPYAWKRDLLGIGPAVSRVVPWVVPAKFQAPLPDDTPWVDAGATERVIRKKASSERPEPAAPLNVEATHEAPPATVAPAAPSPAEPVPLPARSFASADLRVALERALQASVAWDVSPDRSSDRRRQLTDECYEAFAHLGAVLAFLQPGEPDVRGQITGVRELLASFGQQPQKLVTLGNRAAEWLETHARANEGLLLFGTVKSIQAEGGLFVTELELAALQRRTVRVYSRVDPRPLYAPGDRLLMLAAFVAHPQDQEGLPGFVGKDDLIVLGSFPVRMPK